jgi:antitoxin component of MazEF toxin-antitoxin module
MSVITYQGTVEKGRIKLAGNIRLPEKTKLFVVVPDMPESQGKAKFDLADLAARMPSDYQAGEVDFGKPVGKEEW